MSESFYFSKQKNLKIIRFIIINNYMYNYIMYIYIIIYTTIYNYQQFSTFIFFFFQFSDWSDKKVAFKLKY